MLYSLEITNFYSIKDTQILDLTVPRGTPDESERLAPIWPGAVERAPKVVALFGANASGKSNVLRALSFLAWFVQHSFQHTPEARLPYLCFLDEDSRVSPTRLAVAFTGPTELTKEGSIGVQSCKYMYELVLSNSKDEPTAVIEETLKYWPSGKQTFLFRRDATGTVKASTAFGLAGYSKPLKNVLRTNASVISTLVQLKHPLSTMLWATANSVSTNIVVQKEQIPDILVAQLYDKNPECLAALNQFIERLDFGIRSIEIARDTTGNAFANFHHNGLAAPLRTRVESHGTVQFVNIFPAIFQALKTGGVAVIDELDVSIHPLVIPEILRWFYDPMRNPNNAQLWMSCQTVSLLEELSKEEIIFCDKNADGRTKVYGLRDIQSVRRNDNYFRKYLSGVYGAVPHIG